MLDVRGCVFVTFELTRCVLAMLGLAMCTSGCATSISLHTRSTCVVSHCVFGMLDVHGCVIAMLDVHSCALVISELTAATRCVLAMLGVHGCVIAMCAGSCTKAISVCIRNVRVDSLCICDAWPPVPKAAPRAKKLSNNSKSMCSSCAPPRGPCVVPRCRAYHETHLQIESTRH